MASRVYKFRIYMNRENQEKCWRVLRWARDYHNAQIEEFRTQLKAQTPEHKAALKANREACKAASDALVSAMKGWSNHKKSAEKPALVESIGATAPACWLVEQRAMLAMHEANRQTRNNRGGVCGWGTYTLVEEAVQASTKAWPKAKRTVAARWQNEANPERKAMLGRKLAKMDEGPRFHSLRDSIPGRVGTNGQLRKVPLVHVSTGKGQVQLHPLPEYGKKRQALRFQVSPTEWIDAVAVVHRPIEGETLQRAWIQCERIGQFGKLDWYVCLTVEGVPARIATGSETTALDVGWRMSDGGLRIATDEHGTEVCRLPKDLVNRIEYVDHLRSLADTYLDKLKEVAQRERWPVHPKARSVMAIAKAIPAIPAVGATDTDQRQSVDTAWKAWKRERLSCLPKRDLWAEEAEVATWVHENKIGVSPVILWARITVEKVRHLMQWADEQITSCHLRRKHIYRETAARLARTHNRVVVEDLTHRHKVWMVKDGKQTARLRRQRGLAAPASFVSALEAVGIEVVKVPAAWTTIECSKCGADMTVGSRLDVTCDACGTTHDQDRNAAINILERASAGAAA